MIVNRHCLYPIAGTPLEYYYEPFLSLPSNWSSTIVIVDHQLVTIDNVCVHVNPVTWMILQITAYKSVTGFTIQIILLQGASDWL